MAIEAILFDLGKVLIDFKLDPMLQELITYCSKPAPEFEKVMRDPGLALRYETGDMTTRQFYEHLCEFGGLQMELAAFRDAWSSVFSPDLLVSEDLLRELKHRYPLILVSNTNEAHIEYIKDHFRVLDYFEHKVFSYEVRAMKPDRRIYERAIELSGKRPESLFFTDDREENVLGARALGIRAHQFHSEAGLVAALRDAGVDLGNFVQPRPDAGPML